MASDTVETPLTVDQMLACLQEPGAVDISMHVIRPFVIDLCRRVIALEDAVRTDGGDAS